MKDADIDTAELNAIKVELREVILRRMQGDGRKADATFTVSSMAVAETLADMIYGAANDAEHAERLSLILYGVLISRLQHRQANP